MADPPDYILDWAGGSQFAIIAVSQADTTLVVHTPGGQIVCDDDSAGDGDPGVLVNPAPAGRYEIWVGTYQQQNAEAQLHITEVIE